MNHANSRALDRVLQQLARKESRTSRRRLPTSSVGLVLGLLVGDGLLISLVPLTSSWLDFEYGAGLTGDWSEGIWRLSEFCQSHQRFVIGTIASVGLAAIVLGWRSPGIRRLTWWLAFLVVLGDAWILFASFLACLQAARSTI